VQPASDRSADRGFTMVELLVVLAILILAVTLAVPPLWNMIVRSKLEGATRELGAMIQRGRLEAVRRSAQVVIAVDPATSQVFAFADRNGITMNDPPDGIYDPVAGQAAGNTDYALGQWFLPKRVSLVAPEGQSAIDGLTTIGTNQVVLLAPDGSVNASGAYRLGDARGNFLEVRIEPQATARVSVRKWDGTAWWTRGEGGHPWEWN
jgi:prepilin-type N-terminal cleavage/methylation domain-containing protein